jgi:hypothetical protein
MTETLTDQAETPDETGGGNNRSTIAFPYSHLGDAERIAQALVNRGHDAALDEVAAELGTTTTSGTFRTKISTARVFGVIDIARGRLSLTQLGRRLVDPKQVARARVDAFLHVPLFNAVYEKYKGGTLPNNKGLENAMREMGVSPKQTDRARQTLQRSAERAGFFRSGSDRLVPPAVSSEDEESEAEGADHGARMPSMGTLSPMMVEMWLTLLRGDGKKWSDEKVANFVKHARQLDKLLTSG